MPVLRSEWLRKKLLSTDSSPSVFRSYEKYKYSVEWSIIRNSTNWNRFKQDPSIASNPNANILGQILVLWIEHMKREEKTSLFDGKKIFIIYVITVRWKMLLSIHWYSTVHAAYSIVHAVVFVASFANDPIKVSFSINLSHDEFLNMMV